MSDSAFSSDWYAPLARNVIAPLWALKEKTPYLRHLKYLEKSQYRSLDEVRSDQWKRLKMLLTHAEQNCPYYRQRMAQAGISSDSVTTWDDFAQVPILTKDDIRENRDRIIAQNIPENKLVPRKTSGSTGVSLSFYVDEDSMQWKRACTVRHDRWAGWELGDRVGAVWGNPGSYQNWRMWLRNLLLSRHIPLDTLKMDDSAMQEFYKKLRRKKPAILFGHAHSLYLFACFMQQNGLSGVRPKGIISTAMVLHDFERDTIERVFDCKVTNRYGCEEVSLIACECEGHAGLHINMDTLVVECLRDERPARPGETGALVVTDLTNYGMPFIRYQVGDTARMADQSCTCGRSYPLIESLEGRIADYVRTPEGDYISGISLTENFAMVLDEVKQMQIVQDELDHLVFKVVQGSEGVEQGLQEDIARLVKKRFGETMRHDIEYVESIQSEASGKYRFCVSMLENAGDLNIRRDGTK